jgi:hypothetical protein
LNFLKNKPKRFFQMCYWPMMENHLTFDNKATKSLRRKDSC